MVNKVILIGNVGADPEVRYLEGGTAVANLRLATTESYKTKDGNKAEQTEWHSIVLWRGLAEIVEKYVKKGMKLYIEGRLRTRSWDDKDGNKRYTTEIYADNMQMLSRAGEGLSSDNQTDPQAQQDSSKKSPKTTPTEPIPNVESGVESDDLPF